MNLQSARERLGNKFANVVEVSSGVLKSVRREGDKAVAAYVFDLNDRLQETAAHLTSYLDDVLGCAYFDDAASPDLRWNHYLFFVVGQQDSTGEDFNVAKRKVEADRNYARKFVIREQDFDQVLDDLDSIAIAHGGVATGDVMQVWASKLAAAGLEIVLDAERPVADVVRIASSSKPKQTTRKLKSSGTETGKLIASSALAVLDLELFRQYPNRRKFEGLGRANLIVGANGVGKTSLLEGIEFLYCGENRRSTDSGLRKVQATLANGSEVTTSTVQQLSDFKTRQRLWYGTNDTSRRNTLANQFARFNFLNTDAAAELALRADDEGAGARGNADSLADLLSGHEATLLWRRIEAVLRAVETEKRGQEAGHSIALVERKAKHAELKAISDAPQQSDAAFAVLMRDLARLDWKTSIFVKTQVSAQFIEDLTEIASRLGAVRQVDWANQAITIDWLSAQTELLSRTLEALQLLVRTLRADERKLQILKAQLSTEMTRRDALVSVDQSAAVDLLQKVSALNAVEAELAASAKANSTIPSDDALEIDEALSELNVAQAASELVARLTSARSSVTSLRRTLAETTASQTRLQETLTQLRALALQTIEHTHSDEACPVCGTKFQAGELIERIDSLATDSSESQVLDLRRRLDSSMAEEKALTVAAARIDHLAKFLVTCQNRPDATTVAETLRSAKVFIERQRSLSAQQRSLQQAVEQYQRSGLTLARLWQLCKLDSAEAGASDELPDVASALQRANELIEGLRQQLASLDSQCAEKRASAARYIADIGLDETTTPEFAIEVLQSRRSVMVLLDEARASVCRVANLGPATELRAWLALLEPAVFSAQTVVAAVEREAASTSRKKTLETQLEQLATKLGRLSEALKRLNESSAALRDIVENDTLDKATKTAVEATHRVADTIFGRIHAPMEYRVSTDAKMPLARREGGESVSLNQVSTGQRAAYALSMFLAMNAQVREGPQVIILDDPISHIDDLNALSFLDYLRNLVLQSNRQLFFATADEKIAGLFAHKFGFLGEAFRTIELSRA